MMQARSSRPMPATCCLTSATSAPFETSFFHESQLTQSGAWPVRSGSIAITWWHSLDVSTAGTKLLASFWLETITARGHDSEVGDQPFGAVLADQRNPVAWLQPDLLQRSGQRGDLSRSLRPARRPPLAVALGPQERLIALLIGPRQEQRNEIVEMFELPSQDPPNRPIA